MVNNVLRVSYVDFFPLVNFNCPKVPATRITSRCLMPGSAVEILNLLTNHLNLTIQASHRFDRLEDYNFMFDDLTSNRTDVYAVLFNDIYARRKNFDFSEALYETNVHIAVRRADHQLKNIFDFFTVYEWPAWISMFLVFILFTLFGGVVRYAECQLKMRNKVNFLDVLWKMVRFQLVQSNGIDYNLKAGRTSVLVFSIFQLCIILGLFQGYILSSVVKPKNPIPFASNEFPRLLKEGKFHLITSNKLDWYYQELETSYQTPFYEIRNALTPNNLYKLVEKTSEVLEIVNEGNGAVTFIQNDQKLRVLANMYCDIVFIESRIQPGYERLMFRKGHPILKRINESILENSVMLQRISRKYLDYRPPLSCQPSANKPKALSMGPYYGVLILFFTGISFACFMFGGELLRVYHKNNCDVKKINRYS